MRVPAGQPTTRIRSFTAILISSASDPVCIFRIIWLQCICSVSPEIPRIEAACLFSSPPAMRGGVSRSRSVKFERHRCRLDFSTFHCRSLRSWMRAVLSNSPAGSTGRVRSSTALTFITHTAVGMSPWNRHIEEHKDLYSHYLPLNKHRPDYLTRHGELLEL
jgi:hypothetical protein